MLLNKKVLFNLGSCGHGLDEFEEYFPDCCDTTGVAIQEVLDTAINEGQHMYVRWLFDNVPYCGDSKLTLDYIKGKK